MVTNENDSFIKLLDAYGGYLAKEGKPHLARPYQNASRQLIRFAAEKGITKPKQITAELIEEFQGFLYDKRDFMESSVMTAVNSIVMFFDFLVEAGELKENIARNIAILPKPELPARQLAHFYTFNEVMRRYLGNQERFVSYNYLHQIEKHLKGFFKYLKSNEIGSVYPVTEATLLRYRKYLWDDFVDSGKDALVVRSQIHRLRCVVRLFRYLLKEGILKSNPAKNLGWESYYEEIIKKAKSLPKRLKRNNDLTELDKYKLKFLKYQKAIGKDPKTCVLYRKGVEVFFEFMAQKGLQNIAQINKRFLLEYYTFLSNYIGVRGHAVSSHYKAQILWSMRLFFRFLVRFDYLAKDPSIELEAIKEEKGLPRTCMDEKEVFQLLDRPELNHNPLTARDKAILELLFSTGVRSDELCSLDLEDIDYKDEMVRINSPKGGKSYQRIVPVGKVALEYLGMYLKDARPTIENFDTKALFLSYSGRRLNTEAVLNMVKKYAHQCGFRKKITTHSFRVTFATLLLRNGADIRYVQELLGHVSIKSTQIYTRLSRLDLKGIHQRFHPRERKAPPPVKPEAVTQ